MTPGQPLPPASGDEPPPETLDELYHAAPVGYLTLRPDGRIARVNGTLLGWLGRGQAEMVGSRLQDFLTPGSRIFYETHCAPTLHAEGNLRQVALDLRDAQGGRMSTLVDWRRIGGPGGARLGHRVLVVDATERRGYERELVAEREHARQGAAALAESEARLRSVVESAADGILVADSAGRVISANPAALRIFGHEAEPRGLIGGRLEQLMPADDAARHGSYLAAHRSTGHARIIGVSGRTLMGRRRDGSEFPVELSVSSFEVGGARFFTGMVRDVSQRVATERALRESEARLRTATESAHTGLVVVNREHRYAFCNRAYTRLLDIPQDDIVGLRVADVLAPMYEAQIRPRLERAFAGERVEYELTRPGRDGGPERFFAVTYEPARTSEGEDAVIVLVTDTTERTRAARAIAASEARMRDLLETVDLGSFVTTDMEGALQFWSKGCERLLGWTAEEAAGRTRRELLGIATAAREKLLLGQWPDDGWSGDLRVMAKDGRERVIALHAMLRRAPDGRPRQILSYLTDVTAQRQAEEVLARSREELEKLVEDRTRDLEQTQVRLAHAQRMEALGQLAGGIAHDFNNVLQAVQGAASLIERRPTDAEGVRRRARMVSEATDRGASITRRLLAFSRRGDLRAEAVDPAALLAGLREVLAHTLGAGIEVRVDAAPGLPPLLADKGQLETVLVNLATNGRDAMADNGHLTLAAAVETVRADAAGAGWPDNLEPGTYLRLSVADIGSGMPPEVLARATEPFFTTKGHGKGTGLGLAMAKGFAEQSGGGLRVESRTGEGSGTTVKLWFPLAPAGGPAARPAGGPPGAMGGAARARLLVVDDEPIVREVLAEELEAEGYAVAAAADGAAALAMLDAGEAVDLLVTDLSMPGMDGVALVREAQRRRPTLPAILLTGFATNAAELAVGGAVTGRFTLLRKPIDGRMLAERVAMMLEGVGAGEAGRKPR